MERERKNRFPKGARYPLFILGLAIIIVGGVAAQFYGATVEVDLGLGIVGFLCLVLSVALR